MPKESKFDADLLRKMIVEGKNAVEIADSFNIKKPILNNYLFKLMQLDNKFYKIIGMDYRIKTPKVTKLGLKISLQNMQKFGFEVGENVIIESPEEGSIIIKKK